MQVVQERDILKQEVQNLESRAEELILEREKLNAEHAQELAVLSSSLSEHLNQSPSSQDASDSSKLNAECEKEIQKLRLSIEDKNYHINNLQQKLLQAQLELEKELDKHEEEIEDLRFRLGNRETEFEKLVEERLNEVRRQYETELEELRTRIETTTGNSTGDELGDDSSSESQARHDQKLDKLKPNLRELEERNAGDISKEIEDRLEEERTRYRVEIMAVKDRMTHQHQVEIDSLITQLEQSNSALEDLKEQLQQEKMNTEKARGQNAAKEEKLDNGLDYTTKEARVKSFEVLSQEAENDSPAAGALREELHAHYQQQIEHVAQKLREEYQGELDDSLSKMEEEWEQQLEKQKNEYEEKIASVQRYLKSQHQNDLDQVTADMEDQIHTLRDSHSEEVTELLGRLRELSEERRKSVIQQDTTEQQVVIIKEECRSKLDSLEQELRHEKEKVVEYQTQMDAVEAQVQAFKAEKEQELKLIEEELRRQCKALVEKKATELKERYQSELNEKLINAERHWRKQYEEDVGKTRSELEESNRTLKDKYERQVSDIMVQMDEVQQRSREVLLQEKKQFEAQQKEHFERQLSEVKEELQPYKDKCLELEKDNKSLSEKYERDLTELKNKISEVEGRYRNDKGIEEDTMKTLKNELELYKNKIQQLQEGKTSLVENYEAQLAYLKKKYDEMEEGEMKTLQEEVNVYTKRAASLEEEKNALCEKYEAEVKSLKLTLEELVAEKESKTSDNKRLENEQGKQASLVSKLSEDLKALQSKYASLELERESMDNKHSDELQGLKQKIKDLTNEADDYKQNCNDLEEAKRICEDRLTQELETLRSKLEKENDAAKNHEEQVTDLLKVKEEMRLELNQLKADFENLHTKYNDLEFNAKSAEDELALEISRLQSELSESREKDRELLSEEKQILEERVKKVEGELMVSVEKFQLLEEAKKASDEQHSTDVASLMSELNTLRNLNAEVEQLRKLEKEKETFEVEVSNLKEELRSYEAKVDELNEINSGSSQAISSLQNGLETLKNAHEANITDMKGEKNSLLHEIEALLKLSDEQANTIRELEEEGENKFGVLLSQHEKELESLKEELEEQIAKKREQLSKDASAKRQRLKEEYESKLRVLYEELVAEKSKMRDLSKSKESLNKKLNASQEENNLLMEEIERLKACEGKLASLEERLTKDQEDKLQQLVAQYEETITSLRETIKDMEASKKEIDKSEFESLKENEHSLKEWKEKIESLENRLSESRKEAETLQSDLKTLDEKKEFELMKQSQMFEEKVRKSDQEVQNLHSRIDEIQREHEQDAQLLADDINVLKKQLDDVTSERDKLQTMVTHLDVAKQSVVQLYDEKIESLVGELEEVSERATSAEETLRVAGEKFVQQQEELQNKVTQLIDENKNLIEKHDNTVHNLEKTLNSEIESKEKLEKRILNLLEQLEGEKAKFDEKLDEAASHRQILVDEFEAKTKVLEDELRSGKNESTKMTLKISQQEDELTKHAVKLQEMDNLVAEKENTLASAAEKLNDVNKELVVEKDKSCKLEKDIQALLESQSSEYVHSLERLRNDLKQEYEENTQQLKKNYENIFAKMEDEHRVARQEKEAELESLKGMVENLEQLNQLKDEEYEVAMTELANNHQVYIGQLQRNLEKEKVDSEERVQSVNKKLDEAKAEKDSMVGKHKLDLTELESILVEQHETKLKTVLHEAAAARLEHEQLRERYEKEIESLKHELMFGSAIQSDLQSEHEKKLIAQKEALEEDHKRQVEKINADFQETLLQVHNSRSEMEKEVKELTFQLEESQLEIGVLKENLTNLYEAKIKKLESQMQDKIQECEKLKEELGNEVGRLTSRVEELNAEKDSLQKNEETESLKLGYEVLLASLRVENNELSDQVQILREEIQSANRAHQQELDFTKTELKRQFKQREELINEKHSAELGKLLDKLENLVQQQNASKTLTEEHMQDIGALRAEFDQKIQRLLQEKRIEVEESMRILEEQQKVKLAEYQERLKKKDLETKDQQNNIKLLLNRIDSFQTETLDHKKGLDKAGEYLTKLRRENSELSRKLREEIAKGLETSTRKGQRTVEQLQMENARLNKENENLKNLLNRPSLHASGLDESMGARGGSHVLQLVKLMEQLVKEKNALELKLRQEILDLKTRFGFLGDASKTSLDNDSLLSGSLSPAKHTNKDSLLEMLHDLRENKAKQDEDVKDHILETENMMGEVNKMINSADFTDRRLQDMLKSQLSHLVQQRAVLIQRLWQLREKHKAVEEKISRQLEGLSSQNSPSDSARSKCYESIIEENLRREKELLQLKHQQAKDLNTRIALEKVALEKHSKEKQNLEREMKKKDKLESELTIQRRDLERKWVGRLREKEFELRREQELLAESKRRDELNGILQRERSPGSTDYRFSQVALSTRPLEPYRELRAQKPTKGSQLVPEIQNQIEHPIVNKYAKSGKRTDQWVSREKRKARERVTLSRPMETWSYKSYKRSAGKKKEEHAGDLSSDDSDVDLGIINDASQLDIDLEGDSDIELLSTQSFEGLDNFDEEWEINLERELRQISTGNVSTSAKRAAKEHSQSVQVIERRPTDEAGFNNTDSKITAVYATSLSKVDSAMDYPRRLSVESTDPRDMHPRTSTSQGIVSQMEILNLSDVSRVESETASLPKTPHSRQTERGKENSHSQNVQGTRASGSSSVVSQHLLDSLFPLQKLRKTYKENGIDSPTSVYSEPALVGKVTRYTQRNEHIGGVYLLNVDEYIDRHFVRSSEEVARLRDLSPSEKRFDL